MIGRLEIDGTDAFAQFGVFVAQGGYRDLVAYPPLKQVQSVAWQECDGEEADLSAPVLDRHDCTVTFGFSGGFTRVFAFITYLGVGAYHDFNCLEIGRTFRLRMVGNPNLEQIENTGLFSVKFADDFPMFDFNNRMPSFQLPSPLPESDYAIGNFGGATPFIPLSVFGITVLQGTLAEIMKAPDTKENMLRKVAVQPGAIYDPQLVTYKSKDVRLNCLMRADDLATLWNGYDFFLHYLVQPGLRKLRVERMLRSYDCYYKSCSVQEFYPYDRIWLKFTVTLTFTGFHPEDEPVLLCAENDDVLITENQKLINLALNYGNH